VPERGTRHRVHSIKLPAAHKIGEIRQAFRSGRKIPADYRAQVAADHGPAIAPDRPQWHCVTGPRSTAIDSR